MSSGASYSEQVAPGRQASFLDLMSRCTAEDLHASRRRFAQTVPTRARGRSNAGVRPSNRGEGRAVEGRQRHGKSVRPDRAVHPRWPAAVALLIVGTLYAVISGTLTFGPRAFLLALARSPSSSTGPQRSPCRQLRVHAPDGGSGPVPTAFALPTSCPWQTGCSKRGSDKQAGPHVLPANEGWPTGLEPATFGATIRCHRFLGVAVHCRIGLSKLISLLAVACCFCV